MKSVQYSGSIAPIIEAAKDQQEEIDALKAEIAELKKINNHTILKVKHNILHEIKISPFSNIYRSSFASAFAWGFLYGYECWYRRPIS